MPLKCMFSLVVLLESFLQDLQYICELSKCHISRFRQVDEVSSIVMRSALPFSNVSDKTPYSYIHLKLDLFYCCSVVFLVYG